MAPEHQRFCWDTESERHGKAFQAYLDEVAKARADGLHIREVFTPEPLNAATEAAAASAAPDLTLHRRAYDAATGTLIAELNDVHRCPPEPPAACAGQT